MKDVINTAKDKMGKCVAAVETCLLYTSDAADEL